MFDLQFMVSYVLVIPVSLIWSWIVMKEEISLGAQRKPVAPKI